MIFSLSFSLKDFCLLLKKALYGFSLAWSMLASILSCLGVIITLRLFYHKYYDTSTINLPSVWLAGDQEDSVTRKVYTMHRENGTAEELITHRPRQHLKHRSYFWIIPFNILDHGWLKVTQCRSNKKGKAGPLYVMQFFKLYMYFQHFPCVEPSLIHQTVDKNSGYKAK